MDQEIAKKIEVQDKKLDLIYTSIERMRKYYFWTMMITIAMIVLPLLALIAVVPWFLSVMTKAYSF